MVNISRNRAVNDPKKCVVSCTAQEKASLNSQFEPNNESQRAEYVKAESIDGVSRYYVSFVMTKHLPTATTVHLTLLVSLTTPRSVHGIDFY